MKKLYILLAIILTSANAWAQNLSVDDEAVNMSCDCFSNTVSKLSEGALMDSCVKAAIEAVAAKEGESSEEMDENAIFVKQVSTTALLMITCENARDYMSRTASKKRYVPSENETANKHYDRGNIFLKRKNYKSAISEYKKALKADKKFVMALDNLAISYRRKNDLKNAIKYYKKSLKAFEMGSVARTNLGLAYSMVGKPNDAIEQYNMLIFYYPLSAEGYYGKGNVYLKANMWEEALEELLIAHKIYQETESKYEADTTKLISKIYGEMKREGKLALFEKKMEEYQVDFTIGE